ncbi:MAG: hypothetical protein K0U54_08890, partial [Bacteroidetes bacterium]|nr:hypothetical protein [Bacteroidota bacterium]
TQAVVGCGHFVATLRREVFVKAPNIQSNMAYASSADRDYIDIPNDQAGGWRLATPQSFAYHIGNTPEAWMETIFQNVKGSDEILAAVPAFKRLGVPLSVKRTVNKLWLNRYLRPVFFKYLGLQEGHKEY